MVVMAALEMQLAQNLMMVQLTILAVVQMAVHLYIAKAVQLLFLALLVVHHMEVMAVIQTILVLAARLMVWLVVMA